MSIFGRKNPQTHGGAFHDGDPRDGEIRDGAVHDRETRGYKIRHSHKDNYNIGHDT